MSAATMRVRRAAPDVSAATMRVRRVAWAAAVAAGCALLLAADGLAAQEGASGGQPVVACRPDDLAVPYGGTTRLRVYADTAPPPRFAWTAAAGTVAGGDSAAVWNLAGVAPGVYEATARAVGADSARFAPCTARVAVVPARVDGGPVRGSAVSGGGQLVGAAREGEGYGLYSYLLFRAPPSAATRERHVAVVAEYLRQMPEVAALQAYRPPAELNVTYVPLLRRLREPTADSVLAAYNHPRALVLLHAVPGATGDGPYLVSSRVPLEARAPAEPLLVQDLSAVPPRLAGLWVGEFVNQAAQERFWEPQALGRMALRLRTTLSVVGAGLGDVRRALDGWITWSGQ
jgi:hypothetical protein